MIKINGFHTIVFLCLITMSGFSQLTRMQMGKGSENITTSVALSDLELQKNIIGKWILIKDHIANNNFIYPKNDSAYVQFYINGACKGYLIDPFKKYNGKWIIQSGRLNIDYIEDDIDYKFTEINDTSLVIITKKTFGWAYRKFKRKSE